MTPDNLNELRAAVCRVTRELGACLEALDGAAASICDPVDPATDALVLVQHLEQAGLAADSAQAHAAYLSATVDALHDAARGAYTTTPPTRP